MDTDKTLRIRRGIVRALYDYSGPQDLDTVAAHHAVMIESVPVALLRQEWDNLSAANIIQPLPGYGGSVAKLEPGFRLRMGQAGGNLPPVEILFGHEVL